MSSSRISALTLTDEESQSILDYFPDQEAFLLWQRDALRDEIERRAAAIGQAAARGLIRQEVDQARATFPTVFAEPAP